MVDNGSAWPGTSIEETDRGGKSWSTILRIASGIWGMDLVSRDVGFAVGVTSLRITSDGGKHWRQVSEPAGHPLVWVEFNTSETRLRAHHDGDAGALGRRRVIVELHRDDHNCHRRVLRLGLGRLRGRPLG